MSHTNHLLTTFLTFFEGWLHRQENYLHQLNHQINQEHHDETSSTILVNLVLTHYREFYEMKSRIAGEDIFLVISPTWLNTLELSLLWIGGYKPSQVLRLASYSVSDLTEETKEEMEKFRMHMKAQERMLMSALAAIHDSVAMPSEDGNLAADQLKSSMETLFQEADDLREMTVSYLFEKLESAHQKLKFIAAAIQLHLRIRAVGNQRDAERQASRA